MTDKIQVFLLSSSLLIFIHTVLAFAVNAYFIYAGCFLDYGCIIADGDAETILYDCELMERHGLETL